MKLKPTTAQEEKEVETVEGMRRRIQAHGSDDAMVHAVFQAAFHRGLSGEDTMTMLAYHALLSREQLMEAAMEWLNLTPSRQVILKAENTAAAMGDTFGPHL